MNFTVKHSSLLDTCSSLEHKTQGRGQKEPSILGHLSVVNPAPTLWAGGPDGGWVLMTKAIVLWCVSWPTGLWSATTMGHQCLSWDQHADLMEREAPPGWFFNTRTSVSQHCGML